MQLFRRNNSHRPPDREQQSNRNTESLRRIPDSPAVTLRNLFRSNNLAAITFVKTVHTKLQHDFSYGQSAAPEVAEHIFSFPHGDAPPIPLECFSSGNCRVVTHHGQDYEETLMPMANSAAQPPTLTSPVFCRYMHIIQDSDGDREVEEIFSFVPRAEGAAFEVGHRGSPKRVMKTSWY